MAAAHAAILDAFSRGLVTVPSVSREIPWQRLLREFEVYVPESEESALGGEPFVQSIVSPAPPFVRRFLDLRERAGAGREEAVRDLYFFLLKKRYDERLNLLHFAFLIFDDCSRLPQEVVDRTPFPHEDGAPLFGDPSIMACDPPTGS